MNLALASRWRRTLDRFEGQSCVEGAGAMQNGSVYATLPSHVPRVPEREQRRVGPLVGVAAEDVLGRADRVELLGRQGLTE